MTHIVYNINPQTLNMNIYNIYKTYTIALNNFNADVEKYMKTSKKLSETRYINKKKDILNNQDGYYLKPSNKYPNRINIYEKRTRDIGYIFSNILVEVKKILIFSIAETNMSIEDTTIFEENKKKIVSPKYNILYLEELKNKLSTIKKAE